ncbi:MAG: hypothetical protein WCF28_09245 [Methanobacterium sp.]|uniref:hypothetical protein n=1 Tax=Methanobacterium sp. TaxID=2164 RepID=UPI003C765485
MKLEKLTLLFPVIKGREIFSANIFPPDNAKAIKAAENPKIAIIPIQSIRRLDKPRIMVWITGTAPAIIIFLDYFLIPA